MPQPQKQFPQLTPPGTPRQRGHRRSHSHDDVERNTGAGTTSLFQNIRHIRSRIVAPSSTWCMLGLVMIASGLILLALNYRSTEKTTLVVYIFSDTDPEYYHNLNYFITHAINPYDRCDYYIVVQSNSTDVRQPLLELPANAQYVFHKNECYDWGTVGWLLYSGIVNVLKYKYFILMNSSVRGPFVPSYMSKMHWTEPFLSKLTDTVKLVGPAISCEGTPFKGDEKGLWRRSPHVQSYLVATDSVGLHLLQQDPSILACHDDRWDTIFYSELGSSWQFLKAGYNIDCLMLKYQGVDWRDRSNWNCNKRLGLSKPHYYDGVSMDPLEVMFVKLKQTQREDKLDWVETALAYGEWQYASKAQRTQHIHGNRYVTKPELYKYKRVVYNSFRGPDCFDHQLYASLNPDLDDILDDPAELWQHYLTKGQFQSRPYNFTCEPDIDSICEHSWQLPSYGEGITNLPGDGDADVFLGQQ